MKNLKLDSGITRGELGGSQNAVMETLMRMHKDIDLKQEELRVTVLGTLPKLKPLLSSIEYQVSTAFDMFFNSFRRDINS
jgi:hypothetical protein